MPPSVARPRWPSWAAWRSAPRRPTELLPDTARVVAETLDVRFATVLDAGSREILAAHGWDGAAAVEHAAAALDMPAPLVLLRPGDRAALPDAALLDAGVDRPARRWPVAGEGDAPFAVLAVHAIAGEHRSSIAGTSRSWSRRPTS